MASSSAAPGAQLAGPATSVFVEQLQTLRDIAYEFLRPPPALQRLPVAVRRGALLVGAEGAGKSHMLRALAADLAATREACELDASRGQGATLTIEDASPDPRVLIVDSLDAAADAFVRALETWVATRKSDALVIAAARDVSNVPGRVREALALDTVVQIGAPSRAQRASLLRAFFPALDDATVSRVAAAAAATTGQSPLELLRLCRRAALYDDLRFERVCPPLVSGLQERGAEFRGVFGYEKQQRHLAAIVRQWLRPDVAERLGVRPPAGVLLHGPPGCGKTLMATSLAAEQRVAMVSLNGADVFSRYLGESERMVREAFRRARAQRPCVVLLDEVDALAPVRRMYGGSASEGSGSASGGSQVEERVVSALLTEMDGVEALQGVYVIAATARPERVDSALLRPGRLEVHIELPAPDLESRERILAGLLAQCATADDVRPAELAACTQGLTGADLRRLCEEAGLCSLRVHVGPPDEAQLTRASLVEALAACFGRALW